MCFCVSEQPKVTKSDGQSGKQIHNLNLRGSYNGEISVFVIVRLYLVNIRSREEILEEILLIRVPKAGPPFSLQVGVE